jgi:catechol 2,3-dioxygenase-like lactoylglutathione lyase family enzyme
MHKTILLSILLYAVSPSAAIAQDPSAASRNKVRAFDHLVINVTDMERALSFYKRLGFALINEDGWRRGQGQVSIKIGENQKINIHKEEALGAQLKSQATGTADRFSVALVPVAGGADFCVVWEGTIEEAQQHLRASGVDAISQPRRVSGARGPATSVYFRDPDGNLWEFVVYNR